MDNEPIGDLPQRLRPMYGPSADSLAQRIANRVALCRQRRGSAAPRLWTERDTLLITYADQIRSQDRSPLAALREFLLSRRLTDVFQAVHLLPFFPYSSDDGFSVIDYREVDRQVGTWSDVHLLGQQFDLMFDLVLNHASRASVWFQHYLAGTPPYDRYFIEADPGWDLSQVVRPRSLPLLTPVSTSRGERQLWTTFSDDQMDLDFRTPDVLAEMIDILLFYVEQGASIIRLDAIAYLWKRPGTSCIHLPETHRIVKLLRHVLLQAAPDVWLLTETNVPHAENISYFGEGDEAHLVYQFSLPPLLLDALLHQDAGPFNTWLSQLAPAPPGATFFNFTASHDGIGVRPLQGLVSAARFSSLVDKVRQRGGRVSTKRDADGRDSPYELNITYFDALGDPGQADADDQLRRFLTSQAIMLGLQGVPAVYFHSLVGSPNDHAAADSSGQARRINRHRYSTEELEGVLTADGSVQRRVFQHYCELLRIRRAQPAFSPIAGQRCLPHLPPTLIGFEREDVRHQQRILVLANVTSQRQQFAVPVSGSLDASVDLLSGRPVSLRDPLMLEPLQTLWLSNRAQ